MRYVVTISTGLALIVIGGMIGSVFYPYIGSWALVLGAIVGFWMGLVSGSVLR